MDSKTKKKGLKMQKRTMRYEALLEEAILVEKSVLRLIYDKYIPVRADGNSKNGNRCNTSVKYDKGRDAVVLQWDED